MLTRDDFHREQNVAIELIFQRKKLAIWMSMGGGKTVTTLTAISDLYDGCAIDKVLVIAPLRVAGSVWHNEIDNWEHLQHLTFSRVLGSPTQRLDALHVNADIYVINRENVPWLVAHCKNKWLFDMVVIDESDSFKSNSSKRWKQLRKVMPYVNYMVQLTGTPSPNGLLDIWSQLYLLDSGKALGKTMSAYKAKYFISDYLGFTWNLRICAEKEIYKAIEGLVYRPKPAIDISQVDIIRKAPLPPKLSKQYKELEKEFVAEIQDHEISVMNAAALSNKLLQYANGSVYDEDKNIIEVHSIKIDMLKEVVEEAKDEPILVAYNYKSDLVKLKANFPEARVLGKGDKDIKDWNAGKIQMLFIHPQSGGHGLNLQHGGSIVVWYGMTWNLAYYQQLVARLARQGQTKTVRNIHLLIENTIDEKIVDAIEGKAESQRALLAYLIDKMRT